MQQEILKMPNLTVLAARVDDLLIDMEESEGKRIIKGVKLGTNHAKRQVD